MRIRIQLRAMRRDCAGGIVQVEHVIVIDACVCDLRFSRMVECLRVMS